MILGILIAILFGRNFLRLCLSVRYVSGMDRETREKALPKRYNHIVPEQLDRLLRYFRYVVLIMVLYQTALSAKLLFQSVDPYYALFNFFTNEVAISAYIVLGIMTILSLFVERPWCKYFCPYGAFLGIFNPIRIFKVRRSRIPVSAAKNATEPAR